MSLKMKAWALACQILKTGIEFMGERTGAILSARLAEQLIPIVTRQTAAGSLHFYCPNHIAYWQAENCLSKEPETIAWIDSFQAGDVFWDVGANMGVYALYAGLKPGVTVLAFEPAAANYHALNENVAINSMADKISAYCLAFNDISGLDYLYMQKTAVAEALHNFGGAIDWQNKPFKAAFKQAALGFSLDDFMEQFQPPFPTHLKLDVDGIENKILKGAAKTIANKRLKSLLVELNIDRIDYCQEVIAYLEQAGLTLHSCQHGPLFHSGPFASVYNHIFIRS